MLALNHEALLNEKLWLLCYFIILTARSAKFFTRQWSNADCPTVAIISRLVTLSKYGNENGASQYDGDDGSPWREFCAVNN